MPDITQLYSVGDAVELNLRGDNNWHEGVVTFVTSGLRVTVQVESGDVYALSGDQKRYIRFSQSTTSKPREHSFKNWMDKLEGKNNDYILKTQSTRTGFGKGIDLLHEFLQRHIRFRDFNSRLGSLDLEERQATNRERQRLGVLYPDIDTMGLYSGNRCAYQRSVEYLSGNQAGEQQGTVQEPVTTPRRPIGTTLSDVHMYYDFEQSFTEYDGRYTGSTYISTRSR